MSKVDNFAIEHNEEARQEIRRRRPKAAVYADARQQVQEKLQAGAGIIKRLCQIDLSSVSGPFAPLLCALGLDNMAPGVMTAWTGKSQDTFLYQSIKKGGEATEIYEAKRSAYVEMGINLGTSINCRNRDFFMQFLQ